MSEHLLGWRLVRGRRDEVPVPGSLQSVELRTHGGGGVSAGSSYHVRQAEAVL